MFVLEFYPCSKGTIYLSRKYNSNGKKLQKRFIYKDASLNQ